MLNENLEVYLPQVVSADGTNGGRISANKVISGVVQNVWPHVPRAERTAGSIKFRKLFCKVSDDDDGTLVSPQYWLDDITPGDDWFTIFAGTPTDTEADISAAARKFGVAAISTDVTAGTKTIIVTLENSTLGTGNNEIFQAGDKIRPTDKPDPTNVSGNEEFLTIDTVSLNGLVLTITTVEDISFGYLVADGARVSSIYEPADCETGLGTVVKTSASGTFDDTLITLDNIGTIDQDITLTFSDASNYVVTSNVTGVTLASGSINSDYSPQNADFSKPYINIPLLAFGGAFVQNDTIVIPTKSASFAIWECRTVPAAAASQANNKITLVTAGEAA